jgi:hypothetical protein
MQGASLNGYCLYCSKSLHGYLTNLEHQVYQTFLPLNFLVDWIYVGPSSHYSLLVCSYGEYDSELYLLTADCTSALYKYSVHPMSISWLYCRPLNTIM